MPHYDLAHREWPNVKMGFSLIFDPVTISLKIIPNHPPGLPHTWECPLSVPEAPLAPLSRTWSPSEVGSGHASWPAISSWTCRLAPLPAPIAHPGARSAGHALCPCRAHRCQPAWEHNQCWASSFAQLLPAYFFMQALPTHYAWPSKSTVYQKLHPLSLYQKLHPLSPSLYPFSPPTLCSPPALWSLSIATLNMGPGQWQNWSEPEVKCMRGCFFNYYYQVKIEKTHCPCKHHLILMVEGEGFLGFMHSFVISEHVYNCVCNFYIQ